MENKGCPIRNSQESFPALRDASNRQEELVAILNTATDAIITINRDGIIQMANPATTRMFQFEAPELIGQNISVLMPEPYRSQHNAYIGRYRKDRTGYVVGQGRDLIAQRKDGTTFPISLTVSDIHDLGMFAGIIRDESKRVELQRQILEIASEEDRRIGNELHDSIQQQLSGLGLIAQTLADSLEKDGNKSAGRAQRLASGIKDCNHHVHLLSRGLVPVEIDGNGFQAAVLKLANSVQNESCLRCSFDCPETIWLTDSFKANHLFRIIQEAVTNAIKHSQASEISISMHRRFGELCVEITDNGVGIDQGAEPGLGMRTMRYRAELIAAGLKVNRAADKGTVVNCVLSIP